MFGNLTPLQKIGIILIVNGALAGGAQELTDIVGPNWTKIIVAIASLGNSIFGGIVTLLSSQGNLVKSVAAMPGVENIGVNSQANSTLASLAVDQSNSKIAPIHGSELIVKDLARPS